AVMPGPRPDWGWHGYDGWNQGNRVPLPSESLSQASTMAADMAPYLKYAHLWKLSSSAVGGPTGVAAGPPPAIVAPTGGVAAPTTAGRTSSVYTPNVEWRGAINPDPTSAAGPTQTSYTPTALPARPVQVLPDPPPNTAGYRIPLHIRERIS